MDFCAKKVTLSYFLTLTLMPQLAPAMSLMEAISIAFDKNPKTRANDLKVESARDRVTGAKLDLYPSLNLGMSRTEMKMDSEDGYKYDSQSGDLSISTSVNLYRGFADINSIKSRDASAKAMDARYKSTDALIPNTKGSLAMAVADSYFSILFNQYQSQYMASLGPIYQQLLKSAKTAEEEALLRNTIMSNQNSLISMRFSEQRARRDFHFFTTVPAPAIIDNFDSTIASLVIPATAEEALSIALNKSPSVKAREYDLESARYAYKADLGRSRSPRIDLFASKDLELHPGSSNSTVVGISVKYNLSASSSAYNRASAKQVESATMDRDGALDDLKYELESAYPSLANYEELHEKYLESYTISRASVMEIVRKIEAGENVDVQAALSNVSNLTSSFMSLLMQKKNLADMRFAIQRTIGTLFESAERSSPIN